MYIIYIIIYRWINIDSENPSAFEERKASAVLERRHGARRKADCLPSKPPPVTTFDELPSKTRVCVREGDWRTEAGVPLRLCRRW